MPPKYKLPHFTTTVAAQKSVEEVIRLLVDFGATSILTDYELGQPSGIAFTIAISGKDIAFKLPVKTDRLLALLRRMASDRQIPGTKATREHALNVGWRILLFWTKEQVAMIATDMVKAEELLLPWAIMIDGETVSEHMLNPEKGLRMLTGGISDGE